MDYFLSPSSTSSQTDVASHCQTCQKTPGVGLLSLSLRDGDIRLKDESRTGESGMDQFSHYCICLYSIHIYDHKRNSICFL